MNSVCSCMMQPRCLTLASSDEDGKKKGAGHSKTQLIAAYARFYGIISKILVSSGSPESAPLALRGAKLCG